MKIKTLLDIQYQPKVSKPSYVKVKIMAVN